MMKKTIWYVFALVFLLFVSACQSDCEDCVPVVETTVVTEVVVEEVEVTRVVTVEVTPEVTPPVSETVIEGEENPGTVLPEGPVGIPVRRNELPSNLLEIFYSTRTDSDGNQIYADPFLENELILFGPSSQMDELLLVLERELDYRPIDNLSLVEEEQRIQSVPILEELDIDDNDVRLLGTGQDPVDIALERVNQIIGEPARQFSAFIAGRNYLVAAPWDVEGSPWDEDKKSLNSITDGEKPLAQWAFGADHGINLYVDEGQGLTRTVTTATGSEARIVIFDTTPITNPNPVDTGLFTETVKIITTTSTNS